jgi:putative ABC transport system permease protein
MQLHPIFAAMRRNKVGAMIIAVQMAVTLAILCNALFIIEQRLASSKRPSGTDEASLFSIDNEWVGTPDDLASRVRTDVEALRGLPDVEDAYVTNAHPLTNSGWSEGVSVHPNQLTETATAAAYFGDEHLLRTLGMKLVAGRNFDAAEIVDRHTSELADPAGVIVTRELANKLFPDGSALGRSIYIELPDHAIPIVGIVDKLTTPWTSMGAPAAYTNNSVIEPFRILAKQSSYVIRVKPNRMSAAMAAAQAKLFEINHARVLRRVKTLTEWREKAYKDDRGLAVILGIVCAALIAVTSFGIVGLTSYWVAQRRRQIGIRRALGATRTAIVHYFQTENFVIAAAGAALGVALAIALNLWMVNSFEMARLPLDYTVVGAVIVLLLGQAAVLWPALRAASIPPAMATRNA